MAAGPWLTRRPGVPGVWTLHAVPYRQPAHLALRSLRADRCPVSGLQSGMSTPPFDSAPPAAQQAAHCALPARCCRIAAAAPATSEALLAPLRRPAVPQTHNFPRTGRASNKALRAAYHSGGAIHAAQYHSGWRGYHSGWRLQVELDCYDGAFSSRMLRDLAGESNLEAHPMASAECPPLPANRPQIARSPRKSPARMAADLSAELRRGGLCLH